MYTHFSNLICMDNSYNLSQAAFLKVYLNKKRILKYNKKDIYYRIQNEQFSFIILFSLDLKGVGKYIHSCVGTLLLVRITFRDNLDHSEKKPGVNWFRTVS